MKDYKILLFDADNTLFDFSRGEENAFRETAAAGGFAFTEPLYLAYSRIHDSLWRRLGGAGGHFALRCANGICDTWSVHRTGGGASALKLSNNVCSGAETMVLGRRPFNGMQLLPTYTGRPILKAYIAFKG